MLQLLCNISQIRPGDNLHSMFSITYSLDTSDSHNQGQPLRFYSVPSDFENGSRRVSGGIEEDLGA